MEKSLQSDHYKLTTLKDHVHSARSAAGPYGFREGKEKQAHMLDQNHCFQFDNFTQSFFKGDNFLEDGHC